MPSSVFREKEALHETSWPPGRTYAYAGGHNGAERVGQVTAFNRGLDSWAHPQAKQLTLVWHAMAWLIDQPIQKERRTMRITVFGAAGNVGSTWEAEW